MQHDFQPSGKRAPPDKGQRYYVKLRNGMEPPEPWPVKGTRWVHDGHPFDIIAVKLVGATKKTDRGRQADGSFE